MTTMYNPPHPGIVLKTLYLEPLNLSITAAAKALGISRKTLSEIVNSRAAITADMARRLARAFDTTPESWLHGQIKYDLWQSERRQKSLSGVKILYDAAHVV